MQQRLGVGGEGEIVALLKQLVVGEGEKGGGEAGSGGSIVLGGVEAARGKQGGAGRGEKCRKEAGNAALVELEEAELIRLLLAADPRGDEVAGDDEENVHSDKTARQPAVVEVEDENGQNRQGAQGVDLRAVGGFRFQGRGKERRGWAGKAEPQGASRGIYSESAAPDAAEDDVAGF